MTRAYHHSYKPTIKTSDIDSFIGRTTIKDETKDISEFFYYSRFETFVLRETKNSVSKNDVVRTWNIVTRKASGFSKVKKLPFSRLNLVRDYTEHKHRYDSLGNRIKDSHSYAPILMSDEKIDVAIENITIILSLFIKPWHFKIRRYPLGITLWIHPTVDKLIDDKAKPGNFITYYAKGSRDGGKANFARETYDNSYPKKTEQKKEKDVKIDTQESFDRYPGFFGGFTGYRERLDAARSEANDRLARVLGNIHE